MCLTTPRAEIELPANAAAAQIARGFLTDAVCPLHAVPVLEDALLLTSETITNAVTHGAPPIVLAVDCAETHMEIRVRDANPAPPTRRDPSPFDVGGRGIMLVDVLSAAWGVEPASPTGKEVWFRLLPTRSDSPAPPRAGS